MLPSSLLQHLIDSEKTVQLDAGVVILDFQNYIRNIPILVSGGVKVVSEDPDGHELVLYHIRPGESCIVSILGALNSTKSLVKAVTIAPTQVVFIQPDQVYPLISKDPLWFEFIMQLYQTRFEELLQTLTRSNFNTIEEKIWYQLKNKSALLCSPIVPITHQILADEIGSVREVVSRALKQMEKEGTLRLTRGKVELLVKKEERS